MEKNCTKKALEALIEQKELEIVKLKKQIEKRKQYDQYEEGADQVKALYDAYISVGFTEEQAFELLKTSIVQAASMCSR